MTIRNRLIPILIYITSWICSASLFAQHTVSPRDIDWPGFLKTHDLVWDSITADYYAGAIMGNGLIGNSIYKEGGAYKFHVGRIDVTEGRMPANKSEYSNLYHGARLPIGYFLMKPNAAVQKESMRLELWNAETSGRLKTKAGNIDFKSYVHASKDLIVVETHTSNNAAYEWEWIPLKAVSPRLVFGQTDYPQEYAGNPNPEVKYLSDNGINFSVQNLLGGKSYVVAWHDNTEGSRRRILITISHENSEKEALDKARATLEDALKTESEKLISSHREWWHSYYPASFASFGDARLESYYWIQQYKFATLTRPDRYIIDLQGPWAVPNTPWPAIWMNLNVQLTYSPLFTANRGSMSLPLWKALNDNIENLHNNVVVDEWKKDAIAMGRSTSYHLLSQLNPNTPNKALYETGNLPWILFYYWQYCRWTGNDNELTSKLFPLLKKSIAYYGHIREKGDDGKYHLPETASPEYGTARDCNYDLALLRWGLTTLIQTDEQYGLKDEKRGYWQEFLENLTPYPVDEEQGFIIGANVKLEGSHRHYSHLLMIYPLYEINWDNTENKDIIRRSVDHWQSMPAYLQGYSFTGSSSIYSMMGDGKRAVIQLHKLINKFIKPNTLYRETGPVIETPLAGASSLQDLYLQSWGGRIRVFPAVPDDWREASFIDFRADGAFLVSASRSDGHTSFIQIKSEKGGKCTIQTGINLSELVVKNQRGRRVKFSVVDMERGVIAFDTSAGDVITICNGKRKIVFPSPVKHPADRLNAFGVRF